MIYDLDDCHFTVAPLLFQFKVSDAGSTSCKSGAWRLSLPGFGQHQTVLCYTLAQYLLQSRLTFNYSYLQPNVVSGSAQNTPTNRIYCFLSVQVTTRTTTQCSHRAAPNRRLLSRWTLTKFRTSRPPTPHRFRSFPVVGLTVACRSTQLVNDTTTWRRHQRRATRRVVGWAS